MTLKEKAIIEKAGELLTKEAGSVYYDGYQVEKFYEAIRWIDKSLNIIVMVNE